MEAFLESLGTPGPALFAVAGWLALAHLVGHACLRRFHDLGAAERVFLALTLGFDLLALVLLPLAWGGWLAALPVKAVLGVALGITTLRLASIALRRNPRRPGPPSFAGPLLPLVLLALLFLGHGISYPFAWDDLVYQVAVPLRWVQTNSLQVFPDNPYSGFPGAFSIVNAFLIRAGGVLAPGVFNACLWLILSLQLRALLRRNMGRWSSTVMALSFSLCVPMVMEAISSYAELFLLVHVAALVRLADRATREGVGSLKRGVSLGEALLLGILSGLAASIKLTGVIVPVLVGAWLGFQLWSRTPRSARSIGIRSAGFLVPLLAVLLAFYSRPALATGNPVYPYFAERFTDDAATLAVSTYHHAAGTAKFGVTLEPSLATVREFVSAPFQLALGSLGLATRFDGWLGLQVLLHFVLLAWLLSGWIRGRLRDSGFHPWLAGAGLLYGFWFVSSWQARFLLPAFFLLTFAASFAWPLLARPARAGALAALLVLTLASIPKRTYGHLGMVGGLLTGRVSPLDSIDSTNPDHYLDACAAILDRTPPDARILLLFEHRGLYIPRDHCIGTPYFQAQSFTPPDGIRSAADFLAVLGKQRITHVLVGYNVEDPDRMDSYLEKTRPFQELIVSLRNQQLEVLWEQRDGAVVRHGLYEVKPL